MTVAKRKKKPVSISETEFLQQVIDFAHLQGWKVAHFRPLRRQDGTWETPCQADAKGFPDLFLLNEAKRHAIAAELKVGTNRVTGDQDAWLNAMERCRIAAYVWCPDDWDEIGRVLELGPEEAGGV